MKLITANGKTKFRMSRKEWEKIGNDQGWMKLAEMHSPQTREVNNVNSQE